MKFLVFDIWGDLAHFRRGYTTTSPLTYPFPPRTVISGIIAAILGLKRDSYYEILNSKNTLFGLQILNPIKKIKINQNLIDTKTGFFLWDNKGQRTQIPFEYLKEPKYRIFANLKNTNLFENLINLLSMHKTIYTIYLGISECIANFKFVGVFDSSKIERKDISVNSIIEFNNLKNFEIVLEEEKNYGKIKMPGDFNKERIVTKFNEFIYEENAKNIRIKAQNIIYYKINNANIIPF